MITRGEFEEAMETLRRRHAWFVDNVDDDADRFRNLSAELGVNPRDMQAFIWGTLENATGMPSELTYTLAPELAQAMAIAFWTGLLVGKKIKEVETV